MHHLQVPPGVRWDAAIVAGSQISPYYDPLIAKLIVTRPDRPAALDALRDALDGLVVGPVPTNAGFLRWLTDQPLLRDGAMTTDVIDALGADEIDATPTSLDAAGPAATAWLAALGSERSNVDSGPWSALGSFRLTEHVSAAAVVLRDAAGELHEVPTASMSAAGRLGAAHLMGDSIAVNLRGHTVTFAVPERSDAWAPTVADDTGDVDSVAAPFPAVVVEVTVTAGDVVAAGDTVVVVEAMKMLHSLVAHGAGTVSEVRCAPGDAIEANQVLVSFTQHERVEPSDPA